MQILSWVCLEITPKFSGESSFSNNMSPDIQANFRSQISGGLYPIVLSPSNFPIISLFFLPRKISYQTERYKANENERRKVQAAQPKNSPRRWCFRVACFVCFQQESMINGKIRTRMITLIHIVIMMMIMITTTTTTIFV